MKKLAIITLILTLCLFASSCQKPQLQSELYTVLTNDFSMRGKQYYNSNAKEEKVVTILDKSYTFNYSHSTSSGIYSDNLDYYYDDISDCQIAYSTTTGKLSKIYSNKTNGIIMSAGESLSNADSYFIWLKSVINKTFDVNVDDYTFNCTTYYSDHSSENSFVLPSTNTEKQVDFYFFEYVKYIGKYTSAEKVRVIARPDGSLDSLIHFELPCNDFENIAVDEDKLNQTIEKTVYDTCPSKFNIKNFKVDSIMWELYEGKPYLLCGVEITYSDATDEEINSMMMYAIAP